MSLSNVIFLNQSVDCFPVSQLSWFNLIGIFVACNILNVCTYALCLCLELETICLQFSSSFLKCSTSWEDELVWYSRLW